MSVATCMVSSTLAAAAQPSFDCAKASTQVEEAICTYPDLAELDNHLSLAFKQAYATAQSVERQDLLANQRAWLKQRSTTCFGGGDARSCIAADYRFRLRELARLTQAYAAGASVVTFGTGLVEANVFRPKDVPAGFNGDIEQRGLEGHLISCSAAVEVPLTRVESGVGGDCTLQDRAGKKTRVFVCNDTGVGRFALLTVGKKPASKHDLAQFTADNCTGG